MLIGTNLPVDAGRMLVWLVLISLADCVRHDGMDTQAASVFLDMPTTVSSFVVATRTLLANACQVATCSWINNRHENSFDAVLVPPLHAQPAIFKQWPQSISLAGPSEPAWHAF